MIWLASIVMGVASCGGRLRGDVMVSEREELTEVKKEAKSLRAPDMATAWSAMPSVGTWLQARPKQFVLEKVVPLIESDEKSSVNDDLHAWEQLFS